MRLRIFSALIGVALAAVPAAASAATAEDVIDGLSGGVFVEPGAEADSGELRAAVADAGAQNLDLTLIVLADETVSAVSFAGEIGERVGGTVMVFTPAEYGVSSDTLSQDELDRALTAAADDLASADTEAGIRAFVASVAELAEVAEESGTNWPLLVAIGAVMLIVVGVGGRAFERRATADRRRRALEKRWAELRKRADGLADPILELSTPVQLLGDRDVTLTYREASELFERVRGTVDREPSPELADDTATDMDRLDELLTRIKRAVDASSSGS